MGCNCGHIFEIEDAFDTCPGTEVVIPGLLAAETGEHTLKVFFLGSEKLIKKEFESGEEISFPTHGLNENFEFTSKVLNPEGAQLELLSGGTYYDCFRFKTVIKQTL